MAQQCGTIKITGTIDDLCFYKMDGKYYVRMKSSLTRKRVLKDSAFLKTREHAAILGKASKIASRAYRLIQGPGKKYALYREMTGKAMLLLRKGKESEEIFQMLCSLYLLVGNCDQQASEPQAIPEKDSIKDEKQPSKYKEVITAPLLKQGFCFDFDQLPDFDFTRHLNYYHAKNTSACFPRSSPGYKPACKCGRFGLSPPEWNTRPYRYGWGQSSRRLYLKDFRG